MDKTIEKDFVQRTLHILETYDGPYGVTLLVNCLLGLIILPKERDYNHISDGSRICFGDSGIREEEIKTWGSIVEKERTVERFLRCMRNSVAHVKIESRTHKGEIESLRFCDNSGFEAVFSIERLKEWLTLLAKRID